LIVALSKSQAIDSQQRYLLAGAKRRDYMDKVVEISDVLAGKAAAEPMTSRLSFTKIRADRGLSILR